jgi:RimJ/RimL family protein N-acetyltransferase
MPKSGDPTATRLQPISQQPQVMQSIKGMGPEVSGFSATATVTDVVLEGARIAMRPYFADDFEAWRRARTKEANRVRADTSTAATASADDFASRCDAMEFARLIGTDFEFGVFEGDEVIGEILLATVRSGGISTAFLSGWIDADNEHAGYAAEAAILALKFAFEELELQRVEFAVPHDNSDPRRTLEAHGLRNEGVAKRYVWTGDGWHDATRYAITADEWQERRARYLAEATG